jgi:hypothetical protein
MKHTVHVTVVLSVDVDDSKLKAEFGRVSEKMIVQYAMNHFDINDAFHTEAKIVESYDDVKPLRKARKGIGSY